MSDLVMGLVAVVLGVLFCFGGYWALRSVISLWGGLAGFGLGAGLVATFTGDALLAGAAAWVVAILLGLVFAALAYAYYSVAVILSMGSAGFALGGALATTLGLTWGWLATLIGLAAGVVVALIAVAMNLPMILLMFVSALAGAMITVAGVMLMVGVIGSTHLASAASVLQSQWWWYALYLALLVAGLIVQSRSVNARRRVDGAWSQPAR